MYKPFGGQIAVTRMPHHVCGATGLSPAPTQFAESLTGEPLDSL